MVTRVYRVFNADQVDGSSTASEPILPLEERICQADEFFRKIDVRLRHGGDEACYFPSLDQIHMPAFAQFKTAERYYSVLAHELAHWTGAEHRLNRNLEGQFGNASYAMEELIAELGSAFVS